MGDAVPENAAEQSDDKGRVDIGLSELRKSGVVFSFRQSVVVVGRGNVMRILRLGNSLFVEIALGRLGPKRWR